MSAGLNSTQSDPVNPWLSILIPVYNVAPYVSDCLRSILHQVDSGVEIIALDDCSTDQSLALLQEIAANSPHPILVLKNTENRGLSAARNRLLDAARGDYIWFIDSDDLLAANAINALAQKIRTHRPDLVLCDFSVLRTEKRFKHQFRDETHIRTFPETGQVLMSDPIKLFEGIFQKRKLHIWSKISRRSLWGTDLRFPEGRLMEDIVVTPRLCLRVKTYLHVNKPWVIYRQREGSILATPSQKKINDMAISCNGILDLWLKEHPHLTEDARFRFAHFCVRTHIFVRRESRELPSAHRGDLRTYRAHFHAHIHWNKARMCWEYIRRGWLLRLRRFLLEY